MDLVNKPFECPMEDCSLSFANEDHLVVHKKKHELSLSLTPTTPYKTLFDQTPTPTRFINALDSADLFQDFNTDNPFDATFRKVNSGSIGTPNFIIPESSSLIASLPDTSEVLNTPSITLPSEPPTPIILKTDFSKIKLQKEKPTHAYCDNTDSLPFSPHENPNLERLHNQSSTNAAAEPESTACVITEQLNTIIEDTQISIPKSIASKSSVVQTPVITSVGSTTVLKSNATCVPTAVVTRQVTNVAPPPTQVPVLAEKSNQVNVVQQPQAAVVQSLCVTPMLQLMIRLPDGQTMPVQFPVMSSTPAAATVAQPAQQAPIQPVITATDSAIPAANILAKMRLKDMLKFNKKTMMAKRMSNNKTKDKLQSVQPVPSHDLLNEFDISPPLSPIGMQKSGHSGRRRGEGGNIDEKRKRSLERNRAAATRCREKRKQWITALERKADELSLTNTQLQQEVAQLRNEVAHLKTLLLAHKDCPVTQQQKNINFETEKHSFTTIQVITTTDDLQRVPSSSGVSPVQHGEYMEVEMTSSIQSSSDLSLASEGSETSFKER